VTVDATTVAQLAPIRGWLEDHLAAYLEDLARLVAIDSGTYTKSGVDAVGRWVAERLRHLGAATQVVPQDRFGDVVVGILPGDDPAGPRVLLVGHLDTVFDEGTAAARPFRIDGQRATGPGVSDMKGGLLLGLYALEALRATAGPLPLARIVFVANPDEEVGSPVSTPVIRRWAEESDVCFVLESARASGDIVGARKGVLDLRITLHGRAAHAGVEPEKGRSAILAAAHLVVAIQGLTGQEPGLTANVGVIRGGTRPNVVADWAVLEVDLRAPTRSALQGAEAALRTLVARPTVPDVSAQVEVLSRWWPMERSAGTAALADLATAVGAALGLRFRDVATGGASDANTTAGLGVPTLDGLGPVGGLDHSPDEYLEVDSIVPRATLLAGLLLAVGRDQRFRPSAPETAPPGRLPSDAGPS
jgi:glutamate carboxypeptidase